MKRILLVLLLTTSLITFSQDFQVSNTGIYSVDIPHIAIDGTNANLVYGTNFRYYKFDVNGPAAPIDNALIPTDNYGPNTTDVAIDPKDPNHVAIVYYDFHYDYNSGVQFYGCYVTESTDGGETFDTPTLLDTIQYGNTLSNISYNLPQVKFLLNDYSSMEILWRVDTNKKDTNALYLGSRYGSRIRVDDPSKNALELAVGFTVDDKIAVSYGIMEEGHAKFYLYGTGITVPVMVIDDGETFLTTDHFSKAFLNTQGIIQFIFNDFAHSAKLMVSPDWGTTWNDKGIIDSHQYRYVAFERHQPTAEYPRNYYIKLLLNDDNNLQFFVSGDLISWQDGGIINSSNASIESAGGFIDLELDYPNKYFSTAWIDNRTGNSEIFYAKVNLPDLVSVDNKTPAPTEFVLQQNYPNPFNPSTTISFTLPEECSVKLIVYNSLGEEVATLINREMSAGFHSVNFNASSVNRQLSSGLYFYRISAGNASSGSTQSFVDVKKMLLLK